MCQKTRLALDVSLFTFLLFILTMVSSLAQNRADSVLKIFPGYDHPAIRAADSLYYYEESEKAIPAYRRAEKLFETRDDWQGKVYCNYMLADLYANHKYDKETANIYINKAYKFLKPHLNENQLLKADFYLINGTMQSKSDSGKMMMNTAFSIYRNMLGPESISVGEYYFDLGQSLNSLIWEFDSSNVCMELSRQIFEKYCPRSNMRILRTYYYQASNYHYLNDFKNSIIYSQQILSIFMQDSAKNAGSIAICMGLLGNTYSDFWDYRKARKYYNLSAPYYKKIYGAHDQLCLIYLNICENYLNQGDLINASEYLNKALQIDKKNGILDASIIAQLNIDQGRYLILSKKYDSVDPYLKKALKLIVDNSGENLKRTSEVLELYSMKFNRMGKYDSALNYIQKALMKLDTTFKDSDYRENPRINFQRDRNRLYNMLSLKAQIFSNLYYKANKGIDNLIQALQLYGLMDKVVDQMRNSNLPEESQLVLTSIFQNGNESGIDCAQELYNQTKDPEYFNSVLKFMEKSKYMQLFKAAHIAQRSNKINVPEKYLKTYDSLNLELSKLDQKIEFENMKEIKNFRKISDLNTSRLELVSKRSQFTKEMNIRYPNFFFVDFDSLTIKSSDIEDYLANNNRLFIEYYFGVKSIYSLAISNSKKSILKIPVDSVMENNIYQYLLMIRKNSSEEPLSDFKNFSDDAFALYDKLLKPVLEQMNFNQAGNLLIVPDGELAEIPFGAFIRQMPEKMNGNYAGLHYLMRDYLIRYVYSANLLLKNLNRQKPAKNNMLAFSYTSIEKLAKSGNRALGSNELPGTALEMSAIKKVMKGRNRYFEDDKATEHNFKIFAPQYRILHLGVHGQADLTNPLNSRLLFKTGGDTTDDGTLYDYELYDLDLHHTELAVLSACETGIGKEYHGEGVFSVARGFVYAGCPAVIMSLWKVDDIQSAKIMEDFYRLLNKGDKTAEALRASKLHFLETAESHQAHPSNWAAFVMLGQNEALAQNPIINYYIAVVGVLLIFLIIFLLIRFRRLRIH